MSLCCSGCKKAVLEFKRGKRCVDCFYASKRAACKTYHVRHLEENRQRRRAYYEDNKEHLGLKSSEYHKQNRGRYNQLLALRRSIKERATPAWADDDAIAAIYAEAKRLEALDGIQRQVDHIVPLKSRLVSGFHCSANLQILTAKENARKGNRWWPDMP